MKNTTYIFSLTIGDWSGDGHGKKKYYTFYSTHPQEKVFEAYKQSCIKTGIQLHGGNPHWTKNPIELFDEVEQNYIEEHALKILKNHGIDIDEYFDYIDEEELLIFHEEEFIKLFFDFIRISLPELEYEIYSPPKCQQFGGNNFNAFIGYGLFDVY